MKIGTHTLSQKMYVDLGDVVFEDFEFPLQVSG